MTVLFRATVAIALLAFSGATRPAFAQVRSAPARPQQPATPSAGSIGTTTPPAARIGTTTPPAGRIGSSPPPSNPSNSLGRVSSSRPLTGSIATRPGRRVFPFRVPWFGIVYVDSAWWAGDSLYGAFAPPVSVGVDDGRPVGGLQLDVEPRRALVYVDGSYVGIVDTFSGYFHHLDLAAGPHIIEFLAADYDPLTVEILAYPGELRRIEAR